MSKIIRFISIWLIPIGFIKIIARRNDKLFSKDSIEQQTYWRISESKKIKGADVLIRRT